MDDHPEDDAGQDPGRGEEDAGEDVPRKGTPGDSPARSASCRRRNRSGALPAYWFRSSSESMISAKELTSRAPTIGMPLMKKVGVPVTPYF